MREETRQKRIKEHRCTYCGVYLETGYTKQMCPECRELTNKRKHDATERRKAQGICIACGVKPSRPNRIMCLECAVYFTNYATEHRKGKNINKKNFSWDGLINE